MQEFSAVPAFFFTKEGKPLTASLLVSRTVFNFPTSDPRPPTEPGPPFLRPSFEADEVPTSSQKPHYLCRFRVGSSVDEPQKRR